MYLVYDNRLYKCVSSCFFWKVYAINAVLYIYLPYWDLFYFASLECDCETTSFCLLHLFIFSGFFKLLINGLQLTHACCFNAFYTLFSCWCCCHTGLGPHPKSLTCMAASKLYTFLLIFHFHIYTQISAVIQISPSLMGQNILIAGSLKVNVEKDDDSYLLVVTCELRNSSVYDI